MQTNPPAATPAPAPVPADSPGIRPAPAAKPATVRVTPAWWVPWHAFAVLGARLVYPLAFLGIAAWLVALIIKTGASAWFILAVLLVLGLGIAAAPKDPEA